MAQLREHEIGLLTTKLGNGCNSLSTWLWFDYSERDGSLTANYRDSKLRLRPASCLPFSYAKCIWKKKKEKRMPIVCGMLPEWNGRFRTRLTGRKQKLRRRWRWWWRRNGEFSCWFEAMVTSWAHRSVFCWLHNRIRRRASIEPEEWPQRCQLIHRQIWHGLDRCSIAETHAGLPRESLSFLNLERKPKRLFPSHV